MRIDSWEANTAVVHLSSENLIAEEIVTKHTAVRVSEVVGISSGDIGKISEQSVHRVVLFVHIVEVFSILIDSVGAEHVLEQIESIIVLVLERWSIVENTNIGVDHLVISDHKDSWDVDGSLGVLGWDVSSLGKGSESLLNLLDDLAVVDLTSGNDDDVVTVVVGSVVISEHVDADLLSDVSVALDWLTDHVLSVDVEVAVLNSGLVIASVVRLMLGRDLLLGELKLSGVQGWVADGITEKGDGSASVVLLNLDTERGEFSIGVTVPGGAEFSKILGKFTLGFGGGSTGKHLLEKIGSTSG